MKKKNVYSLLIIFCCTALFSQVGIGTLDPDDSSCLELKSDDSGLLLPRMSTEEKNRIQRPAHSLIVYDRTLKCISINIGTPDNPNWTCIRVASESHATATGSVGSLNIATREPSSSSMLADIPDDNFRSYLKTEIGNAFEGDKLKINDPLVTGLIQIKLDEHLASSQKVANLKGIEYFTGLHNLNVGARLSNELTNLDVSSLSTLEDIVCSDNNLNTLTGLDRNNGLKKLTCSGNNLRSLNLANNPSLYYLGCNDNQLSNLDVTKNIMLTELNFSYNMLVNINLSMNLKLTKLNCSTNRLASLNLRNNTQLIELHCNRNNLTGLDLQANTKLTHLDCRDNSLTTLNLQNNCNLIESELKYDLSVNVTRC